MIQSPIGVGDRLPAFELADQDGAIMSLPLAARYADVWNGIWLSIEEFQDRSSRLDNLLVQEGRQPQDVKRTMMAMVAGGRNDRELEESMAWMRMEDSTRDLSLQELIKYIRDHFWADFICGPPELVVEKLQGYADAGVEEVMLQWGTGYVEGIHLVAEEVLPHLRG